MIVSYHASLGERLLCAVFPARCLLCGAVVSAGVLFCEKCQDCLPDKPFTRKLTLQDDRLLLVASPMAYSGGFRKTLHAFKFNGQRTLAKPIAKLMADTAKLYGSFDMIVYTPMYKSNQRARGYNQSRLLAEQIGKEMGFPTVGALKKIRRTKAQHNLDGKERRENLRDVYRVVHSVKEKRLLVVDDIVTTGSTLKECAQVLYTAGAKDICALCAADTI